MKDSMDSTAARRAPDTTNGASAPASDDFSNRRLIRPSLPRDNNHRAEGNYRPDASNERRERPAPMGGRKPAPPEQTHAENFYYQKQMQTKTPMVFVLKDGEEVHGTIEWYDKSCLKVVRSGGTNLLIYKPSIKYIYKEAENGRR